MKNNRGITVLTLAITIIVMIIITSITVYNGVNVLNDARKKEATDKLSTICNSLRKDDSFLEFTSGETILTENDYIALDLHEFYDRDYPVLLERKLTDSDDKQTTQYILKMYEDEELSELFASQEFTIERTLEKNVYLATFDELKGVNMPILLDGMYALMPDGSTLVNDVYEDAWYSYNPAAPSFAKMKYDSNGDGSISDETTVYVWIPRFAYSIQNYYDGKNYPDRPFTEVPSTAIKIVFLREDSNYMTNDEVVPSGFTIHPAFESNDTKKSGFWVAVEPSQTPTTFSSAVNNCNMIAASNDDISSHLMTNSEFSASLYLIFAYDCMDKINFRKYDEFVAAGASNNGYLNSLEYVDLYEASPDTITGIVDKNGDAMTETNWDRYTGNFPTSSSNIIVRLLESGYFNFTVESESSMNHYRPVITTK